MTQLEDELGINEILETYVWLGLDWLMYGHHQRFEALVMMGEITRETPRMIDHLIKAVRLSSYEIVELMLRHKLVDINAYGEEGTTTPLMKAASECNERLIALLLKHKADPTIHAPYDNSILLSLNIFMSAEKYGPCLRLLQDALNVTQ